RSTMYYRSKLGAGLLSALAMLFAFSATEAHAITYTATEVIEDALGYDFFDRNLRRTRTDSTGTVVENSDSTIVSENNVDGDFGYYNLSNVSYSHNLNWITPEAGTFLHASLTIYAYGVDGDNDQVYVDQINIG